METEPVGSESCDHCGDPGHVRRTHSQSIVVAADAQALYDMLSDVTRTGEWSPICTACWWDEPGGPRVGAWFSGRNQTPQRTWQTRSQVVAADPGRQFAWAVGAGYVRWGYQFSEMAERTLLMETWEFMPTGMAMFHEKYGSDAHTQIDLRTEQAVTGIAATLAAIKRIAEGK